MISIEQAFTDLMAWCRGNDFAGHDPFDALNSKAFQVTPFSRLRTARLLWTQALKRSPVNLRPVLSIPKQKNSKGIALFALAALATYRRLKTAQAETDARALLDELVRIGTELECTEAWVLTDSANVVAQRLYESVGAVRPPDRCIMYTIPISH